MLRALVLLPMLAVLAACGAIPQTREPAQPQVRAAGSTGISAAPGTRQCLANLGKTGSRFTPLPDKYFGAGCSNVNSVSLTSLRGDFGDFSLGNVGPVTCPTAAAFAGWARFGVDRAARQVLGAPLERIETMGSYTCRNVAGTARRSGHSTANAVDIAAFMLADGRRVAVAEGWDGRSAEEREFLRTVHRSACKRFGTVLGPDYNAAHRDHIHIEQGQENHGPAGGIQSAFCR